MGQKENLFLKNELDEQREAMAGTQTQMQRLMRTVNALKERIRDLETHKTEEVELRLESDWSRYSSNFSAPKAVKIGRVVYLSGLVKDGSGGLIATLPQGWRPAKYKFFCQYTAGDNANTLVQVKPSGDIQQTYEWNEYVSLEGISFVTE